MKKHLYCVIFVSVILIGLSLLLYPTIGNFINRRNQSKVIDGYTQKVAELKKDRYTDFLTDAHNYNKDTANRSNPFVPTQKQKESYYGMLNITGDGMMGYIEIPSIDCVLPIYHGTEGGTLQRAVGHIDWTSLPVGGKNTHTVLSGHRGLPSAKLFTNISKLTVGDVFTIKVLDKALTYKVDKILTVKPQDTSALRIVKDEDLCTLVTCTPYGINTHRLLVRGSRVKDATSSEKLYITSDAIKIEPIAVAPFLAIPMLIISAFYLLKPKNKG